MRSKDEYRVLFRELGENIKVTSFVERAGIAKSSYSLFLNGSDGILSLKKLNNLENCIIDYLGETHQEMLTSKSRDTS